MSWVAVFDEWRTLGDEVVVRRDDRFHLLKEDAAVCWERLVAGRRVKRGHEELLAAMGSIGIAEQRP